MRQADDPEFDHHIQRVATNMLELGATLDRHMNPPTNATFGHLDKAARGFRIRASDIAHTTNRDQAIDFAHPDLAWTGSTQSCRYAVLCVRNVSVSSINDRVQERVRAMPNPPALHTYTGVTVMKIQNEENELDGVGASLEFLESLNESGCPPHTLNSKL